MKPNARTKPERQPQWRRWWSPCARAALLVFLGVQSFPGHYQYLGTSLDSGYMWGFNYVDNSAYLFGRDVVYTYGPLGYLVWPHNVGNNLLHAMLFRLAIHAVFLGSAGYFIFRAQGLRYPALFVLTYVLGAALGMRFEYHLLVVLVLLVAVCMNVRRARLPLLALAGAYAAMLLLTKFNAGVAAAFTVFLSSVVAAEGARRRVLANVAAAALGYAAALGVLLVVYFHTPSVFVSWLRQSVWVAGDYSEAMSYYDFPWGLPASLACVAIYGLLCLWLTYKKAHHHLLALALLPAVFFAYKHGNIRQVGMALVHLFTFVLVLLSVFILLSGLRRDRVAAIVGGYLAVLAITLTLGLYPPANHLPETFKEDVTGLSGWRQADLLCHFGMAQEMLDQQSQRNLQPSVLPEEWLNLIKAGNSTVDAIPLDTSYMPANNLNYVPNPTFQLFEAYNRPLDQIAAAHFADPATAPSFIIWDYDPKTSQVDDRFPLWDPPLTIQTILRHYQPINVDPNVKQRLLLKRRETPMVETLAPIKTEIARGVPDSAKAQGPRPVVAVPAEPRKLYVAMDLELTLAGQMLKFFYRVPPVFIKVELKNGQYQLYHIIPGLACEPMIIDHLPNSATALADFAFGRTADQDRVVSFMLFGPGIPYYRPDIKVVWYAGQ